MGESEGVMVYFEDRQVLTGRIWHHTYTKDHAWVRDWELCEVQVLPERC